MSSVEKPSVEETPSNVAILGRYIINPAFFKILEHTKPGKGGEILRYEEDKIILYYIKEGF